MLKRNPATGCLQVLVVAAALTLLACQADHQQTASEVKTSPARPAVKLTDLPLKQVHIDDPFWSPRIKANREQTLTHVWREIEENGNISNLEILAGKKKGQFRGPYWADSDVHKWLQGASYVLANNPDPDLEAKVDGLISTIVAAQGKDGYVDSYIQLVNPSGRWENLGFHHELFTLGSLIEAGVAHFEATGKRTLLDVAIRVADNIDATFGPGKREGTSGHEEIEQALMALYRTTGEQRYLRLTEYFLNERGQKPSVFEKEYNRLSTTKTENFLGSIIPARGLHDRFYRRNPEKFDTSYCQDHLPVREQTEAVGHAVRAMYLYAGMADVVYETGDQGLMAALLRLHDSVALRRMYVTGGIGPSAHNEGFEKNYDLPNESAYQETCATVGLALWNHRMLKLTGDGRYADLMEASFYNSFLGGVSLEGGTFCYVNPMRSDGDFERSSWFSVPCCPTTIVRTFPRMGTYIYSQSDDGLWVNLFISGDATAKLKNGQQVTLKQTTKYPWEGTVRVEVQAESPQEFTLHLRVPGWAGSHAVKVNGQAAEAPVAGGYADVHRQWATGDAVELSFPLDVQRLEAHPDVIFDHGKVALQRGPMIYVLEQKDNQVDVDHIILPPTSALSTRFDSALLGGTQVIIGQGIRRDSSGWDKQLYRAATNTSRESTEVTAVPYAVWGNRGVGKMLVWVDAAP